MLSVVDHQTPAIKNMKEKNIGFTIVQNFIWSLVDLFGDGGLLFYQNKLLLLLRPRNKEANLRT